MCRSPRLVLQLWGSATYPPPVPRPSVGTMPRTVRVPGGALTVDEPSGTTPPVLAIHGISSQRRLWDWLRDAEPDLSLIAPDLRGRGDSVDVTGPSSISRHAEDMVAVLDDLGMDTVHVCGMSMGGFVALELARVHPERVRGLVLVDGGPPMAPPPGLAPEQVGAAFADRLSRLDREWPTVEDYRDHFVAATAPLLDPTDPVLLGYLEHDLQNGRVRLSSEAVVQDATDVFFGPDRWAGLEVPTRLLHAEWSVGPESTPAYSPQTVAMLADAVSAPVCTRAVDGVDHAAIIMSSRGAIAVAEEIRAAIG